MSVFDKHRDTLEHHETMMGSARGRLAVALDLLTDSLALVGQHGVYCRSERFPGKPRMDIALVLEQLDDAKQLVQSAMEELAQSKKAQRQKAKGNFTTSLLPFDFCLLTFNPPDLPAPLLYRTRRPTAADPRREAPASATESTATPHPAP